MVLEGLDHGLMSRTRRDRGDVTKRRNKRIAAHDVLLPETTGTLMIFLGFFFCHSVHEAQIPVGSGAVPICLQRAHWRELMLPYFIAVLQNHPAR